MSPVAFKPLPWAIPGADAQGAEVMSGTLTYTGHEQTDQPTPETYKFDRRYSARHRVAGRATVQRRDHDTTVYQHPICSVRLQDMGFGGLAGVSDVAMSPNESVAVFFPAHGAEQGWDLHGRVVRCLPACGGYQVAIAFDDQRAA